MPEIFNNLPKILPFLLLYGAIFYFFIIRPKNRKNVETHSFQDNLAIGDSVITIGGIHGVITDIQEKQIVLSLSDQVRSAQMKIQKEAIAVEATMEVYPKAMPEKKAEEAKKETSKKANPTLKKTEKKAKDAKKVVTKATPKEKK